MASNKEHLEELKAEVGRYPKLPGVYIMRDQHGEVIYVGKALELRSRVRSYFGVGDGRFQIQYLMERVWSIDKVVTNTEDEAFILERDFIKRYKPRYNILLKDDKSYLSIRIDTDEEWPRLETVRRVQQDGALYFGPYASGLEIKNLLEVIKHVVPLRSCSNTVFYNRQRPCLEYQIKRCSGPCCLPVDREQYKDWVEEAIAILRGKTNGMVKVLEEKMEAASEELRFEEAAVLRDRIDVLQGYASGAKLVAVHHGESRDAFALYREGKCASICVLKVRFGRISDCEVFSFEDVGISDEELLESMLSQYYESGREVPEEVLLPYEFDNLKLVERVVQTRSELQVEFTVPKIGSKARLLRLAELNARQDFASRFDSATIYDKVSRELAKKFSLCQIPRRIECVDISNLQGSDIVGALVVFYDGVPEKKSYKKYKISSQGKPNDFASIFEVVTRRLQRGQEEDDLPDLLVIDGGAGQLESAVKARDALGITLEIISIAKMRVESNAKAKAIQTKPERVFTEGSSESIPLDPHNDVTQFLQRLRDEVHRFVISFHRKTRAKRSVGSLLDKIPGIGPEKKRRLFNTYGSIERMKEASPTELARSGRMPLLLAEKLLRILKGNL